MPFLSICNLVYYNPLSELEFVLLIRLNLKLSRFEMHFEFAGDLAQLRAIFSKFHPRLLAFAFAARYPRSRRRLVIFQMHLSPV